MHTPGPWFVDRTIKTAPFGICQDSPEGWGIAEVMTFAPTGTDEANARLISAAPELLEALEQMLEAYAPHATLQKREDLHSAVRRSLDAVFKARGEA